MRYCTQSRVGLAPSLQDTGCVVYNALSYRGRRQRDSQVRLVLKCANSGSKTPSALRFVKWEGLILLSAFVSLWLIVVQIKPCGKHFVSLRLHKFARSVSTAGDTA
jgi:hypothetical protein